MNGGIRLTAAECDVCAERRRQQIVEGYSAAHDDQHSPDELASAGACYALSSDPKVCPSDWPWSFAAWKPKGLRRNLVRAAALIIAAIERIDREQARQCDKPTAKR